MSVLSVLPLGMYGFREYCDLNYWFHDSGGYDLSVVRIGSAVSFVGVVGVVCFVGVVLASSLEG